MANKNGGFIGTDGLDAPDPPTAVTPTAGNAQVSVAFTAPTDTGTSAITGFVAQVSTDGTNYSAGSNTGTSSPIVVSSLTNDTAATAKVWAINAYGTSAPSDASASFTPAVPQIGLWGGGGVGGDGGGYQNVIDKVDITTTGNATDFGDLSNTREKLSAAGSSTRGIWAGGNSKTPSSGPNDTMDYVTLASSGNATDFGNLLNGTEELAACSNNTRMLTMGGYVSGQINVIQYVTIANTGNATDFGDLDGNKNGLAALASPTRGVALGGYSGSEHNTIQYVTIGTTGNTTDFGDLINARSGNVGCSSNTRGITWGGGSNVIEYITIASTGNSTDFGDTSTNFGAAGSTSGLARGLLGGGDDSGKLNTIEYITIASTGNYTDFGNLTVARSGAAACGSAHGGIS